MTFNEVLENTDPYRFSRTDLIAIDALKAKNRGMTFADFARQNGYKDCTLKSSIKRFRAKFDVEDRFCKPLGSTCVVTAEDYSFVKMERVQSTPEKIVLEYYGARIETSVDNLPAVLRAVRDAR